MRRFARLVWLVGIVVPPLVMASFAARWFLPLPRHDYWDCVLGCADTWEHGLRRYAEFLWEPFVDQKMVGSKLALLAFAKLPLEVRLGVEIAFGWLLQVVALVVMLRWIGRARGLSPLARGVAGVAASVWLFSPLLGVRFQHHWYSTQYALAVTPMLVGVEVLVAARPGLSTLGAALGCGAFAALAHGTGALGLPALAFVLWAARRHSLLLRAAGCGLVLALFVTIVAQVPPREVVDLPPLAETWAKPAHLARFFVRCFGGPVSATGTGGAVLVCGGVAAAALLWRGGVVRRRALPWLAMLVWGALVAGATLVHRAAVSDRPIPVYFCFFVFVQVAAAVGVLVALPRRATPIGAALLALASWLLVRGAADGLRQLDERQQGVQLVHELFDMPRILGDEQVASVLPRPGFVENRELLKRLDLVPASFDAIPAPGLAIVAAEPVATALGRFAIELPALAAGTRAVRVHVAVAATTRVDVSLRVGNRLVRRDRVDAARATVLAVPVREGEREGARLEVAFTTLRGEPEAGARIVRIESVRER